MEELQYGAGVVAATPSPRLRVREDGLDRHSSEESGKHTSGHLVEVLLEPITGIYSIPRTSPFITIKSNKSTTRFHRRSPKKFFDYPHTSSKTKINLRGHVQRMCELCIVVLD